MSPLTLPLLAAIQVRVTHLAREAARGDEKPAKSCIFAVWTLEEGSNEATRRQGGSSILTLMSVVMSLTEEHKILMNLDSLCMLGRNRSSWCGRNPTLHGSLAILERQRFVQRQDDLKYLPFSSLFAILALR